MLFIGTHQVDHPKRLPPPSKQNEQQRKVTLRVDEAFYDLCDELMDLVARDVCTFPELVQAIHHEDPFFMDTFIEWLNDSDEEDLDDLAQQVRDFNAAQEARGES